MELCVWWETQSSRKGPETAGCNDTVNIFKVYFKMTSRVLCYHTIKKICPRRIFCLKFKLVFQIFFVKFELEQNAPQARLIQQKRTPDFSLNPER